MRAKLPARLTLPSGSVVELSVIRDRAAPEAPARGAPLFSDTLGLLEAGDVEITRRGATVDVSTLPLADFHVLRAVLTKAGLVHEEPVEATCVNCEAPLRVSPCAELELGPWIDGELDDPELDFTLPFGEPHAIPALPLGRVRVARSVTLAPRTVAQAKPLFSAVCAPVLDVTPALVEALGVRALGAERDPERIARALATCDDDAFGAVTDAFLASHYPARLGAVVFCPKCRARNDFDAPFEREVEPHGGGAARHGAPEASAFPSFDAFADRAHAVAEPLLAEVPGDPVELVIDEGTPGVDEGGVALLGAYDPPHPGDAGTPWRAPRVTIWYRTFRAEHDEDPAFDWDDELRETIEHELEHHVSFLRGDDPTDEAERAEIREEARRVVGRREAERRAIEGFAESLPDFARRTWPVWLLALVALVLTLLSQR